MKGRAVLAVSVGCPAGIGPEVAVAAAARRAPARLVLVADPALVERALSLLKLRRRLRLVRARRELDGLRADEVAVFSGSRTLGGAPRPGRPDAEAGAAQLAWIDQATDLVVRGFADALVTGPASKSAVAQSGAPGAAGFLGHTEHLQRRLRAREVTMAFWAPQLVTSLVTTHLPLRDVPAAITPAAVARAAYWTARLVAALARRGAPAPRVAVAALNPHAGEDGLLGDEERRAITPGIRRAARRLAAEGLDVALRGPIGAETAIRGAVGEARRFDAVVAMYHDQATVPSKLAAFGEAVNVTLGLPMVRTSVDHGTGYDIAWSGRAEPAGMLAAVELAARLVASARPPVALTPAVRSRASRTRS